MELSIKYKSIDELIPYVNNTRTHTDEQVQQIANSIKKFKICNPIGIWNNTIVYGHGRVKAMRLLNIDRVLTVDLSHLSEVEMKAYVIADNKLTDNSSFDEDLLRLELSELDSLKFDYGDLGFDFEFDIDDIEDEDFEPNLKEQSYSERLEIVVECENELQQEQIYYDLTQKGLKCRVQSL